MLAVIHYSADRRVGVRSNFDQIETLLAGNVQRLFRWHDTDLFAVAVYKPHVVNTNIRVDANRLFSDSLYTS